MTHAPSLRLPHRSLAMLVFLLLPILLLIYGMTIEHRAADQDQDMNLSGSLRFRSMWLYGAMQSKTGEDWRSMLAKMQSIRTDLSTRYPTLVAKYRSQQ